MWNEDTRARDILPLGMLSTSASVMFLSLVAGAAIVAGCAANRTDSPPQTASGLTFRQSDLGGPAPVRWAIYVPPMIAANPRGSAPGTGGWPLVVFLNGKGECGTDGTRQTAVGFAPAVLQHPERWPCIVLFPQKPDQETRWVDHEPMVLALIEQTRREFNVDASRIYLTGLSQGGAGTWAIAARNPGLFAAVAPVCGYGEPGAIGPALRDMPVWAFHGERDDVVPPMQTRAMVAAIEAAGGKPRATYFPEANHNSWDAAYRDAALPEWLLAQRRAR